MIILDTNVLSELMRPQPAPQVVGWLDTQDAASVTVTAITVAELLYGIERLPDGKRKRAFAEMAAAMFDEDFAGRLLPFDAEAALHYARITAAQANAGRPVSMADAQIAAISVQHNAELATRNVKDFDGLGIRITNPWTNRAN